MMKQNIIIINEDNLDLLIRSLMNEAKFTTVSKPEVKPLTYDEAAAFLGKAKGTLCNLVSSGKIPYHKRSGKVYFFKEELINWIKSE